jgi:alpha-1,6-mannosyltransferase
VSAFQRGRWALALIAGSVGLVLLTGALGPSVAQPPLPGRAGWPPYTLDTRPDPWLVTTLLLLAVGAGAAGLVLGIWALRDGWTAPTRRLIAAGSAAAALLVLVPPMGSADVLVYAAYGRIAATGGDPYRQAAADLAARGDPVGQAVEAPWTGTPSVYGPVATAVQRLAAGLAGPSPRRIVFLLAAAAAIAYLLTTALLLALTGPDPGSRARVALLWAANPLLLASAVNGAHVDTIGVVLAVAALLAVRRWAALAGALVAAACAVKLTFGLVVLALLWTLRRRPRRAAALLATGLVTGAAMYALVGWHALVQARSATRLVSFASPWRLVLTPLQAWIGQDAARVVVGTLAAAAFVGLAILLARALPDRVSGFGEPSVTEDPGLAAARATAVLALAWLLTATYSLPWYDLLAWAPFAVLASSQFDELLVARTAIISAAYVPGREVGLPAALDAVTGAVRGAVAPVALAALAVLAVVTARSARQPLRKS